MENLARTLTLALSLLTLGCPETSPPPAERDASAGDGADLGRDLGEADLGRDLTGAVDAGEDSALLEVVPVEWGLFPAASPPVTMTVLAPEGSSLVGEVDVPPGVVTFRVTRGDDVWEAREGLETTRPLPRRGTVGDDLYFNPAAQRFSVRWEPNAASPALTVESLTATSQVAMDSAEAPEVPGEWFADRHAAIDASSEDPGARVVELLDEVRRNGGPLRGEAGVLFLAAARDDETPPQIRGTWTDWEGTDGTVLRRIGPRLWARWIDVPPGRQAYKVVYGDGETWVTDLANPHVEWDGIDPGGVGEFNSVIRPGEGSGGRIVWWPSFGSPELGNQRDVFVHLPAAYDDDGASFPALYLHDGNESIVRGRFHQVEEASPSSTVLVFVALPSQDVRIDEYTMRTQGARGDDYVAFLAETLVPAVEASFRVGSDRTNRGVAGASLGGLISFWAAMQRPDVFGFVAGMSSSFFWGDSFMLTEISQRGCQDVRYYLDSGSPQDNYVVTMQMRDRLQEMGCDFEYVLEENGRHEWTFWNARFAGVLAEFAEGVSR